MGDLRGFHLAAGSVTQHSAVRLVGPRSVLEVTWSSPASSAGESHQHGSRRDVRVSPELQLNSTVRTRWSRDCTCSPEYMLRLLTWRLVTLGDTGTEKSSPAVPSSTWSGLAPARFLPSFRKEFVDFVCSSVLTLQRNHESLTPDLKSDFLFPVSGRRCISFLASKVSPLVNCL